MMNYDPYQLSTLSSLVKKPQVQDIGGLAPVFQNIAQQQAMQNAALNQQNQLVNDAARTPQVNFSPLVMAMMLRKGKTDPYANAQSAMKQYGASNVYGFGGQGVVPTTTTGMD
jgi:hypothetical protein